MAKSRRLELWKYRQPRFALPAEHFRERFYASRGAFENDPAELWTRAKSPSRYESHRELHFEYVPKDQGGRSLLIDAGRWSRGKWVAPELPDDELGSDFWCEHA